MRVPPLSRFFSVFFQRGKVIFLSSLMHTRFYFPCVSPLTEAQQGYWRCLCCHGSGSAGAGAVQAHPKAPFCLSGHGLPRTHIHIQSNGKGTRDSIFCALVKDPNGKRGRCQRAAIPVEECRDPGPQTSGSCGMWPCEQVLLKC